jgi:hypothetical protein
MGTTWRWGALPGSVTVCGAGWRKQLPALAFAVPIKSKDLQFATAFAQRRGVAFEPHLLAEAVARELEEPATHKKKITPKWRHRTRNPIGVIGLLITR